MREELAGRVAHERTAVLAVLDAVEDDAWLLPTVCEDWTIKDVLAHMTEGERGIGALYRQEIREQGYVDPQPGVDRWRSSPGPAVRDAFRGHGEAAQQALDRLTDETWNAPIKAFGCRRIAQLARLHLFDLTVHGHDITDALGQPAVWRHNLPFVVEFIVRSAPWTFRRLAISPEGPPLIIHCTDKIWTLAPQDDAWALTPGRSSNGEGTQITMTPEDFVLATTGRALVAEALARSTIEGDETRAQTIFQAWRIV